MGFDVGADRQEREVTYDLHDENVVHDIVDYSRSKQVLNEEQTVITLLIYATGWLDDWHDYAGGVITGGSSGGKSHMKQEVVDDMFAYLEDALYSPTSFSPTAIQDDDEWDESMVAALNELQKIPDETLEFLKSAHGDDGGFDYRRNTADPDSDSGFSATQLTSEPKPTVFMLADENEFSVGQELRTRLIEVKVDENEEKNRAVHRMKWGHDHIYLSSTEHEYIWDDPDMWHAVRSHIRDMPTDYDVVIPTDDDNFDGDDWDASAVTEPMFNFGRSESTRASSMTASLVKASAVLNYDRRETVEIDGDEHLVAEPVDVANVIACRNTLLATTHGLTEKKFAIIDAILESGGKANAEGTAVQAPKQDIIEEIQNNPDIATLSKTEINNLLEELDEHLIINKKDNPEDRRQNLYVYDGGAVFKAPNIYDEYEHFEGVEDPIRKQPIEQTIEEQLRELNARMDEDTISPTADMEASASDSDDAKGGLSAFEDGSSEPDTDLTAIEEAVAEQMAETIDGHAVPSDVVEENTLKISHMVGATPVEYDGTHVLPKRQPNAGDRADGIMNPDYHLWDDGADFNDVERQIEGAVGSLQQKGVFHVEEAESGERRLTIDF